MIAFGEGLTLFSERYVDIYCQGSLCSVRFHGQQTFSCTKYTVMEHTSTISM